MSVRLGRVIHWISAGLGAALIAVSVLMAALALLSGQAWAQQNQIHNQSTQATSNNVKPYVRGETGTLADVIESGPDLQPYQPATAGGFAPPKKTIDWKLLEAAVGIFLAGLALLLVGRVVRYVLANE
jgi:hypothetical protein